MTTTDETSVALPRKDRVDPPSYLQKYLDREARGGSANPAIEVPDADDSTPLYLRRFRDRRSGENPLEAPIPAYEGREIGVNRARGTQTKTKEIIPESAEQAGKLLAQVHLIRHGETQGYSTESGLTPLGSWQAHRRGFDISKGIANGERVRIVCADTNRARQTAEQIHKGLLDGLTMWNKEADVQGVTPMEEFRNFQVATPEGLRDVTSAFRLYHKEMEKYERVALGDRPMWLVEMDRFWRTQQGGGDPITMWTSIPLMHFEPPTSTARRFWAGIIRSLAEFPGERLIVATHSGPIRVFAICAFGYDPGEPYNTEEVIVRITNPGKDAFVAYRNRVQEVQVPDISKLPDWWADIRDSSYNSLRKEGE